MKNRRNFFQTALFGLFGSAFISLPKLAFAGNINTKGIVKNAVDGEIYFVRENTPITIYISNKSDGVNSVSICTEEVLPGNGIPLHKHSNEDEMFFFNKGNGIFLLDEEQIKVEAGSTAFVPKGTWHGLKNTGTELLTFTFGYSPTGFEDFFRQIGTLKGTPFKAKAPDEFNLLAKKYGIIYK